MINTIVSGTWVVWLCLVSIFSPPAPSVMSNQCEQSYRLLFKEADRNVFWIAENIYGECNQSNLIQVDVELPAAAARKTTLKDFDKWLILEQPLKQLIDHETPLEILPANGTLSIPTLGLKLRTPNRNEALENMYRQQFNSQCARHWNQGMLEHGIDLPVVSGNGTCKMLYASPDGLYFNYKIDKAYYFADSHLLIVFTKNNSFRCYSEIATMHGFMILRINTAQN